MKKLFGVFLGASLVVALVSALSLMLLVAGNSLDDTFISRFAERVPFLRNFVVKTFPTHLFTATREDADALKVARYDVDFLASWSGANGRRVGIACSVSRVPFSSRRRRFRRFYGYPFA